MNSVIGQCEFIDGKSTVVDALYTPKQVKAHKCKIETEMALIGFQQAFDSMKGEKLMPVLKEG